jgi:hypothetical protein
MSNLNHLAMQLQQKIMSLEADLNKEKISVTEATRIAYEKVRLSQFENTQELSSNLRPFP